MTTEPKCECGKVKHTDGRRALCSCGECCNGHAPTTKESEPKCECGKEKCSDKTCSFWKYPDTAPEEVKECHGSCSTKEGAEGWEAEFEKFVIPKSHWPEWSNHYKNYERCFWSGPFAAPDAIKSFIRSTRQSLADAVLAAVPEQQYDVEFGVGRYNADGQDQWGDEYATSQHRLVDRHNAARSAIIQALRAEGVEVKE